MTVNELHRWLSDVYGLQKWPATFSVTSETYGNVCHELFIRLGEMNASQPAVLLGPNRGIMFKGVELIVENFDNPLQKEMLDLITLMPDSQTQEIIDYILGLRETRRKRDNPNTDTQGGTGEGDITG